MKEIWCIFRFVNRFPSIFVSIWRIFLFLAYLAADTNVSLLFKNQNIHQISIMWVFKILKRSKVLFSKAVARASCTQKKLKPHIWNFDHILTKIYIFGAVRPIWVAGAGRNGPDVQYFRESHLRVSTTPGVIFRPFGPDPATLGSKTLFFRNFKNTFFQIFTYRDARKNRPLGHFRGPHGSN